MRPMKEPATSPWGVRISNTDLKKLKTGLVPQDQDNKWYIYMSATEQSISIHINRSAFNIEYYVLHVVEKPGDDGTSGSGGSSSSAEIVSITWETNKNGLRILEEEAKKEAVTVARRVLECDIEALPEYDPRDVFNYDISRMASIGDK